MHRMRCEYGNEFELGENLKGGGRELLKFI